MGFGLSGLDSLQNCISNGLDNSSLHGKWVHIGLTYWNTVSKGYFSTRLIIMPLYSRVLGFGVLVLGSDLASRLTLVATGGTIRFAGF